MTTPRDPFLRQRIYQLMQDPLTTEIRINEEFEVLGKDGNWYVLRRLSDYFRYRQELAEWAGQRVPPAFRHGYL